MNTALSPEPVPGAAVSQKPSPELALPSSGLTGPREAGRRVVPSACCDSRGTLACRAAMPPGQAEGNLRKCQGGWRASSVFSVSNERCVHGADTRVGPGVTLETWGRLVSPSRCSVRAEGRRAVGRVAGEGGPPLAEAGPTRVAVPPAKEPKDREGWRKDEGEQNLLLVFLRVNSGDDLQE